MQYLSTPAGWSAYQRVGSFLVSAETPAEELERYTESGWEAGGLTGWTLEQPCGTGSDTVANTDAGNPTAMPFGVHTIDTCSSMGGRRELHEARALAKLDRILSAALAREFWTGTLADSAGWTINERLAKAVGVNVVTSGTAVSVAKAIQLLVGAAAPALLAPLALHMTPTALMSADQGGTTLTRTGDLITTIRGDLVIADDGYPGTSTTGTAPAAGQSWIYATARPVVHLGPKGATTQDVDRVNNTITARAERLALITAVPGVWAAQVTL